jgi:very-short-patch-repair endonuclease
MNVQFKPQTEEALFNGCISLWREYDLRWRGRRNWVFGCLGRCESPIERRLLIPMLFWEDFHVTVINRSGGSCDPYHHGQDYRDSVFIEPQAEIGKYRVDFLITFGRATGEDGTLTFGKKIVVECDGHAFHERTKEQARKDRSRDRDLTALGHLVLRYTGSEIHADPRECASQIESIICQELAQIK